MRLPALRRLMPVTCRTATSPAAAAYHVQRRLAHICPSSIHSLSQSQRTMSSASTTSTVSTIPPTTTPPNPLNVTYTPRHDTLSFIEPHHRVLFVGDVHGCFDELLALIAKAGVTVGTDYILLAGDLINKGPKPLELIEWLRTTPHVYSVMGNHGQSRCHHRVSHCNTLVMQLTRPLLIDGLRGTVCADHHVVRAMQRQADGVIPANLSYDSQPHDYIAAHMSVDQRHWYLSLPLSIRLPTLSPPHLLVHAGLLPGVPLERQQPFDLMNIRNVLDDGTATKKRTHGTNWVERYGGEEGTVVFGHCAARGVQLVRDGSGGGGGGSGSGGVGGGGGMRCIGLDSGCCYGKELSGWLLPDNRLVQVTALRMYAKPDE